MAALTMNAMFDIVISYAHGKVWCYKRKEQTCAETVVLPSEETVPSISVAKIYSKVDQIR